MEDIFKFNQFLICDPEVNQVFQTEPASMPFLQGIGFANAEGHDSGNADGDSVDPEGNDGQELIDTIESWEKRWKNNVTDSSMMKSLTRPHVRPLCIQEGGGGG